MCVCACVVRVCVSDVRLHNVDVIIFRRFRPFRLGSCGLRCRTLPSRSLSWTTLATSTVLRMTTKTKTAK